MRQQIYIMASQVNDVRGRHEVLAGRWSFVAGWTRLIVALAASLSTISVLANDEVAALVFSLSTAVVAALNAAFDPADAAKAHRTAAAAFSHAFRELDDMLYVFDGSQEGTKYVARTEYDSDGQPYEAGYYVPTSTLLDEDLDQLWSRFMESKAVIESAEETSPINRLRAPRVSVFQTEVLPETYWGLWRYKRALHYAARANEYREKAQRERESLWRGSLLSSPWISPDDPVDPAETESAPPIASGAVPGGQ
jgi:hypothetical protein